MEPSTLFSQLLDKYLTQTITAKEEKEFFALIQSKNHVPELEAVIGEALQDASFDVKEDPVLRELLFERILEQRTVPVRQIPVYRRWGWAAAILLLLVGTAYLYTLTQKDQKPVVADLPKANHGISPGTSKALLTLSDGTVIVLDSAANGAIAQQGNASVIKLPNGEIRYDVNGIAKDKLMMNTMTTPQGGQYNLTLPDGSKIWLNAASSITYPAVFTGNDRKIRISGEVFVEVAKNKTKPFIVDIDGRAAVQVLGTSFNINSYTNEGNIKTTLIDGSVKVIDQTQQLRSRPSNQSVILQPGQQAVLAGNQTTIHIQTANVDHVLAWKNGFINFEAGSFQEIMRQIERWYNIDVKLEGPLSAFSIGGRMDRGVQLSDLMELLNNFGIRSRLEGRTLILSRKNYEGKK